LTETVGAGILALPIALASIGPLIGIPLLIVLGLVNVLTVAAMAEAASRSVNIRYGNAYFGRMVSDYLGKTGSVIVSITMAILIILVLLAYYFGFSSTLENATRIPAMVWAIFLFMITLYFVRRESLNATIASALVVGAINISLILVLSALSIGHVKITNLLYTGIPFIHNQTFSSSILGPIFGVVLLAYFGHTSVGNCAKVVLQRDPSGRTLIWGCMSGQLAAIAIYIIWIFAVNGAVAPQELANQSGTSLIPLARIVGPEIIIIGSLYVLLAIGMGSVHFSLGLYNLVRERIPNAGIGQIRASVTRRKLILISPLIGIFLISELFLFLRNASFTQPLSFVGVIVISLLGGIIPMLLLISSRKKGEIIPGFTFKILSLPGITPSIYLIFLSSLLIHGLVIWRNSVQGVLALVVGIATIVLTILLNQRGAFSPRLLLELHSDRRKVGKVSYSITSAGSPVPSDIQIRYPESEQTLRAYEGEITDTSSLQSAIFQIPAKLAWDLKVYAYQDGLGDPIESLPVHLDIQIRDRNEQFDLIHLNGEVLTMLQGQACKIVVSFVHRQREMIHGNL
jgi:amino acid permease